MPSLAVATSASVVSGQDTACRLLPYSVVTYCDIGRLRYPFTAGHFAARFGGSL